jgi:hypothetical protein
MRAMIFIVVSPSMTSIRIPETAWALVNLISNPLPNRWPRSTEEWDAGTDALALAESVFRRTTLTWHGVCVLGKQPRIRQRTEAVSFG